MPFFTKFNAKRSSLHLPFVSKQLTSPSPQSSGNDQPPSSPYSRSSLSVSNLSHHRHQQQEQEQHQQHLYQRQPSPTSREIQRHRTISTPTTSFAETLKVMSKQIQQHQFDDVFGSFFFTEKRCRNRAIFMAARLAQNLDSDLMPSATTTTTIYSFWKMVIDRFYTLNYLLYVVPPNNMNRVKYIEALEQDMNRDAMGRCLKGRRGGIEIYFALYYSMVGSTMVQNNDGLMEKARKILEHCLDSEDKLGYTERDAMYIFHGLRTGFLNGQYDPEVVMDDDDSLFTTLQDAVRDNKHLMDQSYVNPFEDDACIVYSDDDCNNLDHKLGSNKSRQTDSGFYDGVL
ncbi:hypothetical protein BC941DRAFT_430500 [Chlamydoabsidia padenii]|nr:hypothetical protein BC941DRAFT_430500 [Chlamydoabsidia padenii]